MFEIEVVSQEIKEIDKPVVLRDSCADLVKLEVSQRIAVAVKKFFQIAPYVFSSKSMRVQSSSGRPRQCFDTSRRVNCERIFNFARARLLSSLVAEISKAHSLHPKPAGSDLLPTESWFHQPNVRESLDTKRRKRIPDVSHLLGFSEPRSAS
ncbi:hypothetical protein KCU85_g4, partial [Aureobasidium melanogenum]